MAQQACYVYMATSPSGLSYIGVSVDPDRRWKSHVYAARRGSPLAIHRAIRKHGESSFKRSVVFEASGHNAQAVCFRAERVFISLHNTLHPGGYNLLAGGDTGAGYSRVTADNHRSKIVAALARPEVRQKMSARAKAYFADPAARELAAERMRGYFRRNPDAVARLSKQSAAAFDRARQQQMVEAARAAMQQPAEAARRAACARKTACDPMVRAAINAVVARPVRCVEHGVAFESVAAAVRWLQAEGRPKAQKSKISQAASGKAKSAYGFQWQYIG